MLVIESYALLNEVAWLITEFVSFINYYRCQITYHTRIDFDD